MADFNWYLNRQGPRGQQGPQGEQGFSPVITVEEDSLNAYILRIQTQDDSFLTTNLRGTVQNLGGTYVRYNRETGQMYAGSADAANTELAGIVRLASAQDINELAQDVAVTPSNVNTMINNLDLPNNYVDLVNNQEINGEKIFKGKLVASGVYGYNIYGSYSDPYIRQYGQSSITLGLPRATTIQIGSPTGISGNSISIYANNPMVVTRDGEGNHTEFILTDRNYKRYITNATTANTGLVKPDGSTITIDEDGTIHGASTYELPIASETTLGGVKIGKNLTIDEDGTLNAQAGGGSGSSDGYGIRGDYSTHFGILDCPNGLIDYNATGKTITLNAGIVLQLAGQEAKTTIASPITKTLTSSTPITLFYGGGELLEVGKVDWSTTEPEDNGVDNYQAWYNPDVTVNPEKQWQFKSNATGNVWRKLIATPLANINMNGSNITRVDYIGYRILDDDIIAQQSDIESLQEIIQTLQQTIANLENRVQALETEINGGNA